MKDVITAIARVIAMENGAVFAVTPGVAYDPTDAKLRTMADALLERVAGTGIDLLALRCEGATLVAAINDDLADEPLSPMAFHHVVRNLSYKLLGEVWDGRLELPATPAPSVLVKVA